MGIFERMSNVLSSNVNALIDRVEDPTKSVELIIVEMKEQITAGEREILAQVASRKCRNGKGGMRSAGHGRRADRGGARRQ